MVITSVVLPVFFVIILGFLLGRVGRIDVGAVARTQLYIFSPALVFSAMAGAEVATSIILKVLLYVAVMMGVILCCAQGAGLLLRGDRADRNAMSLAAVFMNGGFYGIPVCMLAFGEIGVVYATTFVVCSSMIQATLGIFLASAGSRRIPEALLTILKVPLIHAIILARILAHFSLLPPEPFMKMIRLLGQAAIPLGLLLLGMQLDRVVAGLRAARRTAGDGSSVVAAGETDVDSCGGGAPLGRIEVAGGLISAALRIAGGFGAALLILQFFDFDPMLRNVLIVESSMPTAVHAVVYATEFDCRPRLVTIGILTATLLSIVSITVILNYLS